MNSGMQELNVAALEQVNGGLFWFIAGTAAMLAGCSRDTSAPRDTVFIENNTRTIKTRVNNIG